MFSLSSFFDNTVREAEFLQTQFANTSMTLSLCYVGREQFVQQANNNPNISCVIIPEKLAHKVSKDKGLVIDNQPERVFYELHNKLFMEEKMAPKMSFDRHEDSFIHPSAIVSEKTFIGEGVRIGAGAIIEDYTYIGNNVTIECGAIIGSCGHYYKNYDGSLFRVEHAGGVWLESGVQVLSGAVVSKSLHSDFTRIGADTVLSINSHIGHGCQVGERCTFTGNVQVAGFTTIGNDVWVGPSSSIGNLLTIGDKSRIEIGSVVINDLDVGARVSGNFARNHRSNLREFTKKVTN